MLSLVWIAGLANAYNFMDGIDGIAAGQAIVAGVFWLIVTVALGLPALGTLSILVVGTSLGFLLHNLPPARIFMGDVGSTVLGYTFATLPILAFHQTGNERLFVAGFLCVAPFVFDTALTVVRRMLNHENIFQAHRSHLYQRLVRLGYSHGATSFLYIGLAFASGILSLIYLWRNDWVGDLAVLAGVCLLVANAAFITRLERCRTREFSRKAGVGFCSPGEN